MGKVGRGGGGGKDITYFPSLQLSAQTIDHGTTDLLCNPFLGVQVIVFTFLRYGLIAVKHLFNDPNLPSTFGPWHTSNATKRAE